LVGQLTLLSPARPPLETLRICALYMMYGCQAVFAGLGCLARMSRRMQKICSVVKMKDRQLGRNANDVQPQARRRNGPRVVMTNHPMATIRRTMMYH